MLRCFVRNYSTKNVSVSQILKEKRLGKYDLQGWIRNSRKQKEFSFFDLIDGSTSKHLQVIAPSSLVPAGTSHHSALRICGDLIQSSHPGQEVELAAQSIELINSCEEPYPIQPRKHFSTNFIRQFPSYKSKTTSTSSMLRIRNHLTQSIHQYFQQNGYLQIHTPILTSNNCEGGGDVFSVTTNGAKITTNGAKSESADISEQRIGREEYFDKPVYLTVSGQLHLEAVCNGIAKVYTFNPAFRAEKGRTRRHLSEFWMVEAEVAFVQDLTTLLDMMEDLVKHVSKTLLDTQADELRSFARAAKVEERTGYLETLLGQRFHRITFKEGKDILRENTALPPVTEDLGREHELYLCERLGGPVFVYDWPKESKPFYMRECEQDRSLVHSVDLLVPGVGELCGGGLREVDPASISSRMEGPELSWYADLRRKGSAPSAGFGLGFERLIQWLVGVENIKDTIPFYRASHECQM